jgi:hypothetical protein
LSSCNNSVPTSSLLPTWLVPTSFINGLQLPSGPQEYSSCLQYLPISRLQFEQQQSLCNALGASLPKQYALTPSMVLSQCNNYANQLKPEFLNQAQTGCANELQGQFGKLVPTFMTPEALYPKHLNLCVALKSQLQYLVGRAANLANQIQQAPTPELQNELTSCQNLANQLQGQYNNQKSICIALKAQSLCQNQLQNLIGQANKLIGPYLVGPGQGQVFGLGELPNTSNIPANIQNQLANLQIKMLACQKMCFQCCVKTCQALSSCNNTLPTSSLIPTGVVPVGLVTGGNLLPSPQEELSACLQQQALNRIRLGQQQSLCNNLGAQLAQPMTPSEITSQCNNLVGNLFPQLQGQAQSACLNGIQTGLARGVPTQLIPAEAFPQHVRLCALAKHQLEMLTFRVATLKNQLGRQNTPELQNELTQCQNAIPQLQQQYLGQRSVCNAFQGINLVEGRIKNLNSQIASLIGPQTGPGFNLENCGAN